MNEKTYVWIVKVGKLYYSTGLHKPDIFDAKAYALTTNEDFAWMFIYEDVAERIANDLGGTVLKKDVTGRYGNASDRHEMYTSLFNK